MKNIIYLIFIILFTQNAYPQIDNCSACDSKVYTFQDISHLSLLELKILRNEIFARHQYVFKDERLSDYFLENYTWYKPDYNSENNIKLNAIEKQNISLFSKYEKEKETLKSKIIEELKSLKSALISKDTIHVNTLLSKVINTNQTEYFSETKNELTAILSAINLDDIHWYDEKGLIKITKDDGHFLSETSIKIIGNTIKLTYADIGYSELLSDETAFTFGSDFDSTNEYASWYTFKIIENKLTFIAHQAAG